MLSQMDRIRSLTAFSLSRTAFTILENRLVATERMLDSTVPKYDLIAFEIVEMRLFEMFIWFWMAFFIPCKSKVTNDLRNCRAFLKVFLIQSQTAPMMVLAAVSAALMLVFMASKFCLTKLAIGLMAAVNTDLMASQMLKKNSLIAFHVEMVNALISSQ